MRMIYANIILYRGSGVRLPRVHQAKNPSFKEGSETQLTEYKFRIVELNLVAELFAASFREFFLYDYHQTPLSEGLLLS